VCVCVCVAAVAVLNYVAYFKLVLVHLIKDFILIDSRTIGINEWFAPQISEHTIKISEHWP